MKHVMNYVMEVENIVLQHLSWPLWALKTIEVLCCIVAVIGSIQLVLSNTSMQSSSKPSVAFRMFQLQYLSVYLTVMLADWMQGTNMYTLYMSYGVNVGTLFITGFLTSAVFGTFLGIYVDTWGRKLGCLLFCVLEVVINTMEHIPSMPVLLIGRILGGLSTSLLFSAFESWMVSEHRRRGYPEEWLTGTFAISSSGNGIMAILAGFVAQVCSDARGHIGPFQMAIALTIVSFFFILGWSENYGHTNTSTQDMDSKSKSSGGGQKGHADGGDSKPHQSMLESFRESLSIISNNPAILCLGLSQSFFEGAIYSFVFMWVPTLLQLSPPDPATAIATSELPTGLVFSCFMLSMTIGGMVFGILEELFPHKSVILCCLVYAISAISMIVPVIRFEFWPVFISFLVLECMLGMFNSCGATLRSIYYPEYAQASIISVFRFVLNIIVVCGTLLSDAAKDVPSLQKVYCIVFGLHFIAFLFQLYLIVITYTQKKSISKKKQ